MWRFSYQKARNSVMWWIQFFSKLWVRIHWWDAMSGTRPKGYLIEIELFRVIDWGRIHFMFFQESFCFRDTDWLMHVCARMCIHVFMCAPTCMHLRVCACVFVCTHVCMCTAPDICIYVHVCTHFHVFMCMCTFSCACAHMPMCTWVCMCPCVCMCVCVHMCVHVHMHLCMHVCPHMHCAHVYTCACVCMCVLPCMCTYAHVCPCVCTRSCAHVCACVCTRVCAYEYVPLWACVCMCACCVCAHVCISTYLHVCAFCVHVCICAHLYVWGGMWERERCESGSQSKIYIAINKALDISVFHHSEAWISHLLNEIKSNSFEGLFPGSMAVIHARYPASHLASHLTYMIDIQKMLPFTKTNPFKI